MTITINRAHARNALDAQAVQELTSALAAFDDAPEIAVGVLTGVRLHDHNCGFKIYRREVFDAVKLYGEMHRFVPVLATAKGFRVSEVPVNHRARQHQFLCGTHSALPLLAAGLAHQARL